MGETFLEVLMYIGAVIAMLSGIGLFIFSLMRIKLLPKLILRLTLIVGLVMVFSPYISIARMLFTTL